MNYVKGLFSKKNEAHHEDDESEANESEEQEQEQAKKKVKNFPPCYPIVYHSFSACGKKKYLAFMGLIAYFAYILLTLCNTAGLIIGLVASKLSDYIGGIAIAGAIALFFPVIGFFAQYWLHYGACSHKNSARYVLAFISYIVGILFSLFMAIGVPSAGGCGLVSALWLLTKGGDTFSVVFSFVMAAAWAVNVVYQIIIVILLYRHFNEEGSTLGRAKDQIVAFFARRSLSNAVSGVVGN
ncbi:hypothetical protein C9374_013921 [Naegleria lovaniensis]|uniref:Secretory carrier membrane protein n=1 Tax=Naegleria lovaniensis TaxID=51637 RepID=A0AA88H0D1_NAELO|nr:uncharacterized protein C9374_013921 [Naegleria lovaniensis]KAG2389361.1 hypothetical protein C9374_013921 [Naegleria lovaniensis]